MAIALMRHTAPDIPSGICYGRLDVDVSVTFPQDAAAALQRITFQPEMIITSPLKRCRKLADFMGAQLNIRPLYDTQLTEMDFGSWEGVAWDDVPRAELDAWAADFAYGRPHGGENVAMLKARVDTALQSIKATGQSALIITHAGVIKAAKASSLEQSAFDTITSFGGVEFYEP